MSGFIKSVLFFLSPFLLLIPMELSLRNNTFKASRDHIENNKDQIELLVTGSSHMWRAINPEHLDMPASVLAHGGTGLNINLLLFDKYFPQLPKLKYVVFDISAGYLENLIPHTSNKNHLYYLYYGINNYGGKPPLKDNFLLTSNSKNYIDKFIFQFKNKKNKFYNKYGYVTKTPLRLDDFKKANYDSTTIANTFDYSLIEKHSQISDEKHTFLTAALDNAIQRCQERNVKVILLSTPKYYLYTHNMNDTILSRRATYLSKYQDREDVLIWNYEGTFEYDEAYYNNANHLNSQGAEIFTQMINERIKQLD